MKTIIPFVIASLALPCLGQSGGATTIKPAIAKKPPSHEQLAKTQKEQDIAKHGENRAPIKPLITIKKRDLYAISTIFVYNRYWSLVPKGSVIHIPPNLKDVIVTKPKGKIQKWPLFLQKNGGLFHTHEVTMEQAKGKKPIDQKAIEAYKGTGKIVVATYHRQPISVNVKALQPPAADGSAGATRDQKTTSENSVK